MSPEQRAKAALKAAERRQNLKDGVDPEDLNMFTEEEFFVEEIAAQIRASDAEKAARLERIAALSRDRATEPVTRLLDDLDTIHRIATGTEVTA